MDISIPYLLRDVYNGEQKELFTVVSTFAGGGGSSTGYRLAGGKILAINEFIPSAIETYKANYPTTHIFPGDIRELTGKIICKKLGILPGELDILDGSPPCASFSMTGKREKCWGKVKKYSDTTQRVDDLFFEFIRLLTELKPKVFISENVKGLTIGIAKGVLGRMNKGLGINTNPTIISEFQNAGYNVKWKVLNAANYGVPQIRERIVIIGIRNDLKAIPTFPKRTVKNWVTVEQAIWDAPQIATPPINFDTKTFQYQKRCLPSQSVRKIHPKGHYFNFGRYPKNKPAPTILAACGGRYHLHYEDDRYLNMIEGKRLSGFPDDYILLGIVPQQWERLGRAVPPLMMKAIAEHIYKTVLVNL